MKKELLNPVGVSYGHKPIWKKQKEEKCLVVEAMDKCQCESCKFCRQSREWCLRVSTRFEAQKIYLDALKESKIIKT